MMIVDSSLYELGESARIDTEAATVFLDALLESPDRWRDERVIMLCLGVPLDVRPLNHLGETGRRNWSRARVESIEFAKKQWKLYFGRNDFVRATKAALIFGDWRLRGSTGCSPWAVARAADHEYQTRLVQRRYRREANERFRAAREVRERALRAVRNERRPE